MHLYAIIRMGMGKHIWISAIMTGSLFIGRYQAYAQETPYYHRIRQADIVDLLHQVIKTCEKRSKADSVYIAAVPAVGYSLQTGFAGVLSGGIAFYAGKPPQQNAKLSNIMASFTYSQYNQIILPLQSNIWLRNEQYNLISDWRYMKYPSTTFGLGGKSSINDGSTIDFNYIKLHQAMLVKVYQDLFAGLGYYYDYFWNVRQVAVSPSVVTQFQRYGFTSSSASSGLAFRLLYDSRSNQLNPRNGWYGSVTFRPDFTWLGSDNNWQSLLAEVRRYIPFPKGSRNTLALWSYNWLTLGGRPPYLMLPSTGWDDFYNTGRGYIQGRYRGRNMIYLETEYRFAISANGLVGGVVFLNAQSFPRDITTNPLGIVAPGYGAGIRIKLNKFSGTNLCVDYGFGIEGSKGISVNLGEVF